MLRRVEEVGRGGGGGGGGGGVPLLGCGPSSGPCVCRSPEACSLPSIQPSALPARRLLLLKPLKPVGVPLSRPASFVFTVTGAGSRSFAISWVGRSRGGSPAVAFGLLPPPPPPPPHLTAVATAFSMRRSRCRVVWLSGARCRVSRHVAAGPVSLPPHPLLASERPAPTLSGYLVIAFRRVGLKTPGGSPLRPRGSGGRRACGEAARVAAPSDSRSFRGRGLSRVSPRSGSGAPLGRPWGSPLVARLARCVGGLGPRVVPRVFFFPPVPTLFLRVCVVFLFCLAGRPEANPPPYSVLPVPPVVACSLGEEVWGSVIWGNRAAVSFPVGSSFRLFPRSKR